MLSALVTNEENFGQLCGIAVVYTRRASTGVSGTVTDRLAASPSSALGKKPWTDLIAIVEREGIIVRPGSIADKSRSARRLSIRSGACRQNPLT